MAELNPCVCRGIFKAYSQIWARISGGRRGNRLNFVSAFGSLVMESVREDRDGGVLLTILLCDEDALSDEDDAGEETLVRRALREIDRMRLITRLPIKRSRVAATMATELFSKRDLVMLPRIVK